MAIQDSLLRRSVAEIIVEEELTRLLERGKPLRLKQGFDPSCPDIHLGHVVGLKKLRQFQEMGHQVILIVGDWTAQIGDPSGESYTRRMLSAAEVSANAETYMKQFFKVVDKAKTEVRWQSEWLAKFNLTDIIELTTKFTVAQLLAREDFNRRYVAGRPIGLVELLYPLLQAYDSVEICADVEFGGIDQKFNCLMGRELQKIAGQPPQQIFLVPLLLGIDGSQKMSKSLDNYIGISEPPREMYGKVMSIPDHLILDYFELVTDVPDKELEELRDELHSQAVNPMIVKEHLAYEIVAEFCGSQAAQDASEHFSRVFQRREVPEEILPILFRVTKTGAIHFSTSDGSLDTQVSSPPYPADILHALGLAKSRSEARRLISQGAVEFDGKRVAQAHCPIHNGMVIKVGKRRFVKLIEKQEGE